MRSFSGTLIVVGILSLLSSISPFTNAQAAAPDAASSGTSNMLDSVTHVSSAKSRQISPENITGEPGKGGAASTGAAQGAARDLGVGWKVSPYFVTKPHTTQEMANIDGSGVITHIWTHLAKGAKDQVLRVYWDGESKPSIELPLDHFFCMGIGEMAPINSLALCVNPKVAVNSYWRMPFHKSARVTLENTGNEDYVNYYQIDYEQCDVPASAATLHTQYRPAMTVGKEGVYTVLDNVHGRGQYVGTYMIWETHSTGWWGEGEMKFYMDGDTKFPTICGTGLEDYFGGSLDFENWNSNDRYLPFTTAYSGLIQVVPPNVIYQPGQRFGLYRWHLPDPIRFEKDLRVTVHALGWDDAGKYRVRGDDVVSSVAFWYQQ